MQKNTLSSQVYVEHLAQQTTSWVIFTWVTNQVAVN